MIVFDSSEMVIKCVTHCDRNTMLIFIFKIQILFFYTHSRQSLLYHENDINFRCCSCCQAYRDSGSQQGVPLKQWIGVIWFVQITPIFLSRPATFPILLFLTQSNPLGGLSYARYDS